MKRPFMVWIGFISICCSKVAKEGKSCPRLLVLQRVAQNAKSCSKVAEHNLFMPSIKYWYTSVLEGLHVMENLFYGSLLMIQLCWISWICGKENICWNIETSIRIHSRHSVWVNDSFIAWKVNNNFNFYYMVESASGQDGPNPAFWLATRAGKMEPARDFLRWSFEEKVLYSAI